MLDYRNADELANHQVWVPFHFLPGNGGAPAGDNPDGTFINKLVCHPDAHAARDLLRACVADSGKLYGLQRLGITMHVYADTFAHQGFAGINHKINEVDDLESSNKNLDRKFYNKILNFFLSESFPLGHGAALSYPETPFLKWQYKNGLGKRVERDNSSIFLEAVDKMCRAMQCFRKKDLDMDLNSVPGLPDMDKKKISSLIKKIRDKDGDTRHSKWLAEIQNGSFSFGPATLDFVPKGVGSWKYQSIGQYRITDSGRETFPYRKNFIKSNWKLFHDGIQAHRFDVIHDILPKYGICAA